MYSPFGTIRLPKLLTPSSQTDDVSAPNSAASTGRRGSSGNSGSSKKNSFSSSANDSPSFYSGFTARRGSGSAKTQTFNNSIDSPYSGFSAKSSTSPMNSSEKSVISSGEFSKKETTRCMLCGGSSCKRCGINAYLVKIYYKLILFTNIY